MKEIDGNSAMKPRYINASSYRCDLKNVISISLSDKADQIVDLRHGLPFRDGSVDGVFCSQFLESLTVAETALFLRECRRVLKPGASFVLTIPANRASVDEVETPALPPRETPLRDAPQMYETVALIARHSGLKPDERSIPADPVLQQLLHLNGKHVPFRFSKPDRSIRQNKPLVSILIPAYKETYFEEALQSAVEQTYTNLEIVVCDDSGGTLIERICSRYAAEDDCIRYIRNRENIGGRRNYLKCFDNANGSYIKFLNDDDRLYPACVEKMVNVLNEHPEATLVTSHRRIIDAKGRRYGDEAFNKPPVEEDSVIDGTSMIHVLMRGEINFIGEPSSVMFRKSDLKDNIPHVMSYADREAPANGDVYMWVYLLGKGYGVYLTETLSAFRRHDEQVQKQASFLKRAARGWRQLQEDTQRLGIGDASDAHILHVRSLRAGRPERYFKNDTEKAPVDVSIIIPVFNKAYLTRRCIKALYNHTHYRNFEVIVVDNASTDETQTLLSTLQTYYANFRYIRNERNMGFAAACNRGAEAAEGRYLHFLNNDTEAKPGWLAPLVELLQEDEAVVAAGSKLLFPDHTIQHAGVIIEENRKRQMPLVGWHLYYKYPEDFAEANELRSYQALTAASLLIRREAFFEVGRFDEGFWNGYEDVDLCFKLGRNGGKLVYQPRSVLVHYESQSGPERFSKVRENVQRLVGRWNGRIAIDAIIDEDGAIRLAGNHRIRKYHPPKSIKSEAAFPSERPLVSIVILTMNALEYTRRCVKSIRQFTDYPYELIFVDNHSRDGSRDYLKALAETHDDVRFIFNEENRGFAAGNNQGAAIAKGDYLLFLNNDVLVSYGWLSGMVRVLELDRRIGMVGPITNSISGLQMVANIPYANDDFEAFAAEVRQANRNKYTPRRRLAGFAMLMRRAVFEEIGGFDESFGSGNFEDDDLCVRLRRAGYVLMADESTFIHHYGSRTFKANRIDYRQSLQERAKKFRAKWPDVDYEALLERKNPLSERHARLLQNAWEHHHTGDLEGALNYYKTVLNEHPLSTGALFGMAYYHISNEEPEQAGQCLQRILRIDDRNAEAYNQLGVVQFKQGEMERALKHYKMALKCDPQHIDTQRNLADLWIESGQYERGIRLFQSILQKYPDDIPSLLYMARLNLEADRRAEARSYCRRVFDVDPENALATQLQTLIDQSQAPHECDNIGQKEDALPALLSQGRAALAKNDTEAARHCYRAALERDKDHVEAIFGLGLCYRSESDHGRAEMFFKRLLELEPTFIAAYEHLGSIAMIRGNLDNAFRYYERVLELNPEHLSAKRNLSEILIQMGHYDSGIQIILQTLRDHPEDIDTLLKIGELHLEAGKPEASRSFFEKVVRLDPENTLARRYIERMEGSES